MGAGAQQVAVNRVDWEERRPHGSAGEGESGRREAARLARIRLESKTMGSREAQDAINILKRAGDAGG